MHSVTTKLGLLILAGALSLIIIVSLITILSPLLVRAYEGGSGISGNGYLNPTAPFGAFNGANYGMLCDGVHDDSSALLSALSAAAGSALFIPASTRGCLLNSTITYNVATLGGIRLLGTASTLGPGSNFLCNNTAGCMQFTGSVTDSFLRIENLTFTASATGATAYAVQLSNVSGPILNNLTALGSASAFFAHGFEGDGAQKGHFIDLYSKGGNSTGIYFADIAGIGSNQNLIDHYQSLGDTVWCADIEGGASLNQWNNLSCQNATNGGMLNNQTTGTGGFLANMLVHPEFEAVTAGPELDVRQGPVIVQGGAFLLTSGNAVVVEPAGFLTAMSVNFNYPVVLNANTSGHQSIFINNDFLATVTDNSGLSNFWIYNQGGFAPDHYAELVGQVASFTTSNGATAGTAFCYMKSRGVSTCLLTGYQETGAAQTWTYPLPFATASAVILSESSGCNGGGGTFAPSTNATVLTLPANAGMAAETCEITLIGQ